MSNSKSIRPNLKPFNPPKKYSVFEEDPELTLYHAMYSNRRHMRLIKELSVDINAEIERIINDNLND